MILMNHAMMGAAGYQAAAGGDQLFWMPKEEDIGGQPSDLVYSTPFVPGLEVSVVNLGDAPGSTPPGATTTDTVLQLSSNTDARRLMRIDELLGVDLSGQSDIEVFMSFVLPGARVGNGGPGVRFSGSAGSENGAYIQLSRDNNTDLLNRYDNGAFSLHLSVSRAIDYAKKHARIRAEGAALRIQAWDHDEQEPATLREYIDPSPLPSGGVGFLKLGGDSSFPYVWIFSIGIGLNGAVAPTEPI